MRITSTAFQNERPIPVQYGHGGKNVNPPLTFSEVPANAKSLVLTVEDSDAPGGVFAHWILYNMPPANVQINEGQVPVGTQQATNDLDHISYDGPAPPAGTHRYYFKLFALDIVPNLQPSDTLGAIYAAMKDHIVDRAELVGTFAA